MDYEKTSQILFNKAVKDLTTNETVHLNKFGKSLSKVSKIEIDSISFIGNFDLEDIKILMKALRKIDERKPERTISSNFFNCNCMKKFKTKEELELFYLSINDTQDRKLTVTEFTDMEIQENGI